MTPLRTRWLRFASWIHRLVLRGINDDEVIALAFRTRRAIRDAVQLRRWDRANRLESVLADLHLELGRRKLLPPGPPPVPRHWPMGVA